jgi:hypothetical protein
MISNPMIVHDCTGWALPRHQSVRGPLAWCPTKLSKPRPKPLSMRLLPPMADHPRQNFVVCLGRLRTVALLMSFCLRPHAYVCVVASIVFLSFLRCPSVNYEFLLQQPFQASEQQCLCRFFCLLYDGLFSYCWRFRIVLVFSQPAFGVVTVLVML